MKILGILYLIVQTNFIYSQDGSPMQTIDTIKLIEGISQGESNHCEKNNQDYPRKREGFSGTVNCEIKCGGEKSKKISFENTFTNESMRLKDGDGGLHASFNINLDLWIESICLSLASKECKTLNNIESVNLIDLKSGNWVYQGPVYCPTSSEAKKINDSPDKLNRILPKFKEILGPFLKESGANLSTAMSNFNLNSLDIPSGGFDLYVENLKINKEKLLEEFSMSEQFMTENEEFFNSDHLTSEKIEKYVLKKTNKKTIDEFVQWRIRETGLHVKECKKSIDVRTCYGDCIHFHKDEYFAKMSMGSNVISGVNVEVKKICIDSLLEFIKKNNIQNKLHSNYCRLYLNNSFIQTTTTIGLTCSAFRFDNPCNALDFEKLLSKDI